MFNPRLRDVFLLRPNSREACVGDGDVGLARLAAEIVSAADLPGHDSEEWKFTSLKLLQDLKISPSPSASTAGDTQLIAKLLADEDAQWRDKYQLVFVNGWLDASLSSDWDELKAAGITVRAGWIEEFCESSGLSSQQRYRDFLTHLPLAALSTHSAGNPLDIRLRGKVPKPLQLNFIGMPRAGDEGTQHHGHFIHIDVQAGAEVGLFENHISYRDGICDCAYVHHDFLCLNVAEGGRLRHYKLQNSGDVDVHLGHADVRLQAASEYHYGLLHVGGKLARQDLHAHFCGRQGKLELYGLILPYGQQKQHLSTKISHHVGDCQSRQKVKLVAANAADASYQGKIHIASGADGSAGLQHSRGLLLDRKSQIKAKPELEIFADKVECAHGSAIGELDAEPLFYLKSRGIETRHAYEILLDAYAAEIAEQFPTDSLTAPLAVRMRELAQFLDAGGV